MDQHLNSSQNDFLWTLLANPADDAHLYAYNLQRLVNDFPQSGILQALLAHASDDKNLRQASAYFNAKSLFKLINAPSSFIGVSGEKIIVQPGGDTDSYYRPAEYRPADEELPADREGNNAEVVNEPYFDHDAVTNPGPEAARDHEDHTTEITEEPVHGERETTDEHAGHVAGEAAAPAYTEAETAARYTGQSAETTVEHIHHTSDPGTDQTDAPANSPAEDQLPGTEVSDEHNSLQTAGEPVESVAVAEPEKHEPAEDQEIITPDTEGMLSIPEAVSSEALPPVPESFNTETPPPVPGYVHTENPPEIPEAVHTEADPPLTEPVNTETENVHPEPEQTNVVSENEHVVNAGAEYRDEETNADADELTAAEAPREEPEKHINEETFDEIVGIDDINIHNQPSNGNSPGEKPLPEEESLIKENIAATDFFMFDQAFGEHKQADTGANGQAGPWESTTKAAPAGKDADHQDVSKYHDEKMPYTFMWWLDKTRKEHSGVYQPYIKSETVNINNKPKKPADELQQQYFENIFHITSIEDLDKNMPPPAAPYNVNVKRKEQVIIDRFIKEEPQIKPQSSDKLDNENKAKKSSEDRDELVTETLAGIYSDQMLYHKAIASYKKLMLKFPEKSRYFAGKIEQLEKKTN